MIWLLPKSYVGDLPPVTALFDRLINLNAKRKYICIVKYWDQPT